MAERSDNIRALPNGAELSAHSYYASSVTTKDVVWLSPGRLAAGKITVLDGDPGVGKSTITIDLVARITTGRPLIGAPGWGTDKIVTKPRGAVMLSAEDDDADTIAPRLMAAGADLHRVAFLKMRDTAGNEYLPTIGRNLGEIEWLIGSTDAAILVVDPLMAYLDADVKSNSDQDIRRLLSPLASMASRTGCAIIVLRHLNKALGMASLYRGGGSIGIIGAARIGLLAAKDPDDESGQTRVLAVQKCNIGPEMPSIEYRVVGVGDKDMSRIEWRGVTTKAAVNLLGQPQDAEERSEATAAEVWLADLLESGSVSAVEVYRQGTKEGFSQRTIRRAGAKMHVKNIKQGFGKDGAWHWQLPSPLTVHAPNGATLTASATTADGDLWGDGDD